ncbi:S-layer homology domain-containing protein [Demequina sp. NBRC 110053]|uniref:S-layer homology domain-containing protein n=1 Tax=Demequina sp. NBRC 110053 TaxID=1570342 RepID=UPI0013565ED9|nr:S-layer homology domain-containing protein [Demequina sp. NBRC 110053]
MSLHRTISAIAASVAALMVAIIAVPGASAASTFPDVPTGTPFEAEITWLADQGISTGYADGTFRPDAAITRDAMAAFMYRLAGKPVFTAPARSPFEDVTPQSAFYKEIAWLASTGVTTGYADGTFRPFESVTRDAMAAFMYRLAGKPAYTAPARSPFEDVTPRSAFFTEISWLAAAGVTTGWSDGTYRPFRTIARDAMAAFMFRFDRRVGVGIGGPTDPGSVTACNDGKDNDGDGWTDWQNDLGCYGPGDGAETAGTRAQEAGWTTYDKPSAGTVYYVSSSTGSDANDGLSPATAFATIEKGFERYRRDGQYNDYVLLKRGDAFTVGALPWHRYAGLSEDQPFVVATYGESTARPVLTATGGLTVLGDLDHRAFHGLDFYFRDADPSSPTFDTEATGTGLSFYGNTEDMLIEDVRVRYGHLNIQSAGGDDDEHMDGIAVRRSAVAYSWNAKSWTDDPCISGKTQGMYIARVRRLTIEDSYFLHNGWGEEVPGRGCANMFNHNIYAMGIWDSTIRGNTFLHGSSMGLKLSAFGEAESAAEGTAPRVISNVVIEDNFFSDSELGISMGGNGSDPYRFRDNVVRGNVFSEMGSDNATGRSFQWGVELRDNDGALVEDNLFVSSPWYTNAFAVKVAASTNRDIVIDGNLFYDWPTNDVVISGEGDYQDVSVTDNTVVKTDAVSAIGNSRTCLVSTESRNVAETTFSGNQYSAPGTDWFCAGGAREDLGWWTANREPDARLFTGDFVDPTRTLTTYGARLGHASESATEAAILGASRLEWRDAYLGSRVAQYVKDGFALE